MLFLILQISAIPGDGSPKEDYQNKLTKVVDDFPFLEPLIRRLRVDNGRIVARFDCVASLINMFALDNYDLPKIEVDESSFI